MSVLAIVPARIGSRGIPNKNFRELAGVSPVERAVLVAKLCADEVIISSDSQLALSNWNSLVTRERLLYAPAPLHTDECAMVDVIQDVLARVPGPEEQIVVLLQPTQPLREPKHVQAAIALLSESINERGDPIADSVVSVVELPRTHHPDWQLIQHVGKLWHWEGDGSIRHVGDTVTNHRDRAVSRHDLEPTFIRDGTCYAFRRSTVTHFGNIYGDDCRALIIAPSETCALDSPQDWVDAERRLREREG
jgi:CMP-N,N'-diacetyllegionaminic acid synthase